MCTPETPFLPISKLQLAGKKNCHVPCSNGIYIRVCWVVRVYIYFGVKSAHHFDVSFFILVGCGLLVSGLIGGVWDCVSENSDCFFFNRASPKTPVANKSHPRDFFETPVASQNSGVALEKEKPESRSKHLAPVWH